MKLIALLALAAAPMALFAQDVTYRSPGDILPTHLGPGQDRTVHFPDWAFPLAVGAANNLHAYMGTQLGKYHGLNWDNDPKLYTYPHRDNQCEPRKWAVKRCVGGKGHQGQDIRPHSNKKNTYDVVAAEAGLVTQVTPNTTVAVKTGTRTCRYLHMDSGSIAAAGIKKGSVVAKGQVLGKVSNLMGGKAATSIHLHFDCYSGTASSGNIYNIYPSLVAAYLRAWGLNDQVSGGQLGVDPQREITSGTTPGGSTPVVPVPPKPDCDGVALSDPLPNVDVSKLSSLWLHNCSVMGLEADHSTGGRKFVYVKPKASLADRVAEQPVLFEGQSVGGTYSGTAQRYSKTCPNLSYAVSGPAGPVDGELTVTLRGSYDTRDGNCQKTGSKQDVLVFTYQGNVDLEPQVDTPAVPADRVTFSEITRNFLAITIYPNGDGDFVYPAYMAQFPGIADTGAKIDKAGGEIPAMRSDEAGVALSWTWINKRARYSPSLTTTPRALAHSMAGVEPSTCTTELAPTQAAIQAIGQATADKHCNAVQAYARGYVGFANGRGFATDYFGRTVGLDEVLTLDDMDTAWKWMRAMYSHESGRPPVIDRDTFERGVMMGRDYIAAHYDGDTGRMRDVAFYSDPCNFDQAGCATSPAPPTSDLDALRADLQEATAMLETVKATLDEITEQLDAQ